MATKTEEAVVGIKDKITTEVVDMITTITTEDHIRITEA